MTLGWKVAETVLCDMISMAEYEIDQLANDRLIDQSDNRSIESRQIHFIYSTEEISYSAFKKVIYRNTNSPRSLKKGRPIGTRDPVGLIYTLLLAWFHSDHVHAQCQGKLLIAGTISLPTPS